MKTIVNMACGLANRMFQYAYYIYLRKEGYDVAVDYFNTAVLAHEDVAWNRIFPKATYQQASEIEIRKAGGGHDFFSKLRRKFLPFTTRVIEMNGAFDVSLPPKDKMSYVLGVFQSAAIVEAVESDIRACYVFPEFESQFNLSLQSRLLKENSVGIHVRKGKDYQERKWYQNTCDVDYYKKAVEMILKNVENPSFYVFTDNPTWVKEHFEWFDYELVMGNPGSGWGSHCDMQLMSLCKHNIISNSTYSWWGAFLNNNPGKIVICPHVWFNSEVVKDFSSDKLLIKNWISL